MESSAQLPTPEVCELKRSLLALRPRLLVTSLLSFAPQMGRQQRQSLTTLLATAVHRNAQKRLRSSGLQNRRDRRLMRMVVGGNIGQRHDLPQVKMVKDPNH